MYRNYKQLKGAIEMFEELGRKLDDLLYDIRDMFWKMAWAKFYMYVYIKIKNEPKMIDIAYKHRMLYSWQRKKLKKYFSKN